MKGDIMGWLRKRFGEASTHAGLGVIFTIAGVLFPKYTTIIWSIAGALGVGAVAIPEKGDAP
jgi:hypothetical protein